MTRNHKGFSATSSQIAPGSLNVAPGSFNSLGRRICQQVPKLLPVIVLLSAPAVMAMPIETNGVYGKGMVLQTPDQVALPEGVKFNGSEFSIESDRFLGIESLDPSKIQIKSWQTTLPVTMPDGRAAVATFYGSPDFAIETPGAAAQRGFTLPEERITFSTNPEFLRTSGLNGINHNNAFTGEFHGSTINPTEFGNEFIKGGMATGANWMVVRDKDGKVLFEGTPATYGAQLYWDGNAAILSDAEALAIGEGNYQKTSETSTETSTETAFDQRTRQEVVETQHSLQGNRTWAVTDAQQRIEVSTVIQPFQLEETSRTRQNFSANLASIFPLSTVAILHQDPEVSGKLRLKTSFQMAGDVSNASNPTFSGQLRIPLNPEKGTSSLNVVVGGTPRVDNPGQPNFHTLLFAQLNTLLFRVSEGQYRPSKVVAGVRFGGGAFHVPIAAQTITQTVSVSGVDVISERRTINDFTTTTWGQNFTSNFTQQATNDYVDTYRIDTTRNTPVIRDITDVVVTQVDGSRLTASDYRTTTERRGEPISATAESLLASELVASSVSIIPGETEYSPAYVVSQQASSQLVGTEATSQRVVQDVSVKQTVTDHAAWGHMLFINPYVGNFDLASVTKPGSLLYEVGGNFVRSSLLGNTSFKDSNLYLTAGMPLWNPSQSGQQNAGKGLLTLRANATYLPMSNDVRVGVGLQLSAF